MKFASNKGFQATAHKLSLCDRLRTLQSYIVLPVGRRLNPDVGRKELYGYLKANITYHIRHMRYRIIGLYYWGVLRTTRRSYTMAPPMPDVR